ncbi:hypothetical protein Rhopal_001482-T1 [Rhodotorula paludigena]|uniref:F-box domain-containing protein n=1 Tax=Rhodotorula paludigena TaxID=86838 RepID=A0AAV5G7I8_9BASI|nr:hypothetical protein Rhopal_001482-T1 [Rhodotorula paludigena]
MDRPERVDAGFCAPLRLPIELLAQIFADSDLDDETLGACSHTCRALRAIALDSLYNHVRLDFAHDKYAGNWTLVFPNKRWTFSQIQHPEAANRVKQLTLSVQYTGLDGEDELDTAYEWCGGALGLALNPRLVFHLAQQELNGDDESIEESYWAERDRLISSCSIQRSHETLEDTLGRLLSRLCSMHTLSLAATSAPDVHSMSASRLVTALRSSGYTVPHSLKKVYFWQTQATAWSICWPESLRVNDIYRVFAWQDIEEWQKQHEVAFEYGMDA